MTSSFWEDVARSKSQVGFADNSGSELLLGEGGYVDGLRG